MVDSVSLSVIFASIFLLGLALVTVATWISNRRFYVEAVRLTRATEQVAAGDLSVAIDVTGLRELAGLAASFNAMVSALRESSMQFQTIYTTANALIMAHDADFNVVYMNPYACRVLEYEEGEMMGKNINTMIEDSEVRRADPIREQVAIDPELRVEGFEQYYLTKHGRRVLISWNVTALKDVNGKAVGVLGIGQDMTGRKQAEEELKRHRNHLEEMVAERTARLTALNTQLQQEIEERGLVESALRESEARYRELFDTMTSGVAVFEAVEAGADFVLRELNHAAQRIEGASAEEAIGRRLTEIFPTVAQSGLMATFQRVWRSGRPEHVAEVGYDDARHGRVWREHWTYRLPSGEIVAIYNDITGRKEVEKELRQAKEVAEAANEAKSVFLANMSHELRTPLNGILGYAQILLQEPTTAVQRQGLTVVQRSGEHLLELINDILDLAKIEARKVKLHVQPFNLPSLVSAVFEMTQERAAVKNLAFSKRIGRLPAIVLGDHKRLQQVLVNLLDNAIKFTEQGSVSLVIDFSPQDRQLTRFAVSDTGIGITPQHLDHIFDPFEQVGRHNGREGGTGLGLAISQELVGLMGGTLQVTSVFGEGSTFWFDIALPESDALAQTAVQPAQASITGVKGPAPRILVVDDHDDNRGVIVDLLTPLGFAVAEARNGEEGMAQLAALQPHAAILDLVMPGMSGLELIRLIRQLPGLTQLPIIVSSARSYESDRAQSLAAGANAFVAKPINLGHLLDTLRQQLHLEWVYAPARSADVPDASLVWPSEAHMTSLLGLARLGDLAALQELIADLLQEDAGLAPLAARLRGYIEGFQIKQLLAFLEKQGAE